MGYVYLITNGMYHKIGMSVNHPSQRLKQLQTGNPNKLILQECGIFTDHEIMEKYLHQKYKNKRVSGEWFNLSIDEVTQIKSILKGMGETQIYIWIGRVFAWIIIFYIIYAICNSFGILGNIISVISISYFFSKFVSTLYSEEDFLNDRDLEIDYELNIRSVT